MARILRVVALVSIITLSMIAATVVGGGILGINIAPTHNNHQAIAQQIGNQTTMAANQTMVANPDFDARLTGASEVPPVQTNASGFAELGVMDGGNRVEYDIIAINIDKVTMAHIHQGTSSEAGPVVATLFNASTPTGPTTGELTDGFITSANLEGPLQGKQLSDLIALMQNGQAYVNVHTEQNPDGEIRGSIVVDTD